MGSAKAASAVGLGRHTGWLALDPVNSWAVQTPSVSRGGPRPGLLGTAGPTPRGRLHLQKRGGPGGPEGKKQSLVYGSGCRSGCWGSRAPCGEGQQGATQPCRETEGRAQTGSFPPRNAIRQPQFPAHTGYLEGCGGGWDRAPPRPPLTPSAKCVELVNISGHGLSAPMAPK